MQVNRVNLGVFRNSRNYQTNLNVQKNYFSNDFDTVSFSGTKKIRDDKGRVVKEIGKNYTNENEYKGNKLVFQRITRGDKTREITYGKFGQKVKEVTLKDGKMVEAFEYLFSRIGEYQGMRHKKVSEDGNSVEKYTTYNGKSVFTLYQNSLLKRRTTKDSHAENTVLYDDNGNRVYERSIYANGKTVEKHYENGELAVIKEEETSKYTDEAGRVIETTTTKTTNLNEGSDPKVEVIEKVLSEPIDVEITEEEIAEFYRNYY